MLRHAPQFAARGNALATPRHALEKRWRRLADSATLAKLFAATPEPKTENQG
jgi:hypothetical protein